MHPVAIPMIVNDRNVVMLRLASGASSATEGEGSLLEVIERAVAAEAAAGTVFADELAGVGPDEDVTAGRSLRRRAGRRQHAGVVEVVDLAELGEELRLGQLRSRRGGRLGEQPARRP